MAGTTLKLLSYNIHQGLTLMKKKHSFAILKDAIRSLKVDVLFLQEVAGTNLLAHHEMPDAQDLLASQLEALADEAWPYYAYGKNSIFSGGFHGNAILSKYPILHWGNLDMTIPPLHNRGCLHAEVELPGLKHPVHFLAVHLGLWQTERRLQIKRLSDYIRRKVPSHSPLLLAGDFNDWREIASKSLSRKLGLHEAFMTFSGRHARTFPAKYPVLSLDRIYFRDFQVKHAVRLSGRPWERLSDHLPLTAEFVLKGK